MHGAGVTGFQAGRVGTGAWICDDGLAGWRPGVQSAWVVRHSPLSERP
jgi:hypothetical protein